jgi:chaperonin GroEL
MNFLDYSNKTNANIMKAEEFNTLALEVFSTIAETLGKSLGPLGSHSLIIDGAYTSATKDGFTIFKNMRFRNKYKTMIYNLIKAPCVKLNNTVGDATTTAIVMTNILFNKYMQRKETLDRLYRLPRTFTHTWDRSIEEITELVKSYGTLIEDNQMIYDVAYIASNGNIEISKNISEIYNAAKSPVIKLKNSPTNKSYIRTVKGFEFPANLIDEAYCKNEDLSTTEENVKVLLFDYKIDNDTFTNFIKTVNEIYRPNNEKILILAPAYDELLAKTVLKNYINAEYRNNNGLNLILTQYKYGSLAPSQMEDLSVIIGCQPITMDLFKTINDELMAASTIDKYDIITENKFDILGNIKSASLSIYDGSVFTVDDLTENQKYQQQLHNAEIELESILSKIDNDRKAYAADIAKINARISQLKMENFIYYVGADSTLQANILYDTVDDVIKAVASASKYGIVPGCQISIVRACEELLSNAVDVKTPDDILRIEIIQLIKNASTNLYAKVLHGPENNGIIKMIPNVSELTDANQLVDIINHKCVEIISESIKSNKVFDLESLKYSDKVITSVETDVNVLMAASELVKLLISGNQCIFIDYSAEGAQDDTAEI